MAKRKPDAVSRSLGMYGTYSFVDKDPIIDIIRTGVQDYARQSGIKESAALRHISDETHVSVGTLHNWLNGKTRRPTFATVNAVLMDLGIDVAKLAAEHLGANYKLDKWRKK